MGEHMRPLKSFGSDLNNNMTLGKPYGWKPNAHPGPGSYHPDIDKTRPNKKGAIIKSDDRGRRSLSR